MTRREDGGSVTSLVRTLRGAGAAELTLGDLRLQLLKMRSFLWWTVESVTPGVPPLASGQSRDVEEGCADGMRRLQELVEQGAGASIAVPARRGR